MGIRLHISIEGQTEFDATMARFDLDKRDLTMLWHSLANSFAFYERQQFASQGQTFGDRWLPLQSVRYAAIKAEIYPGKPLMEASGSLKRSLTSRPLGVERFGRRQAEFGTNVFYARFHHRGIPKGTKMSFKVGDQWVTINGLPKRPLIGMNQSMRTSWRKKIQRFYVRNEITKGEEL